jgi:hypothetical protein
VVRMDASKHCSIVVIVTGLFNVSCIEGHCAHLVPLAPLRHAVVDIDGDGRPDVITTILPGLEPGYSLFRGTPEGFGPPEAMLTIHDHAGLAVGDVDGDGQADLVVLGASGTRDRRPDWQLHVMFGGDTTLSVDRRVSVPVPCMNLALLTVSWARDQRECGRRAA